MVVPENNKREINYYWTELQTNSGIFNIELQNFKHDTVTVFLFNDGDIETYYMCKDKYITKNKQIESVPSLYKLNLID